MYNAIRVFLFLLVAGCGLVACGGGGSSPPANPPPPPPPPSAPLSTNADLSALQVSAAEFDQIFQAGNESYSATAGFLATSTNVTATTADPNATIKIDGVDVQSGSLSDFMQLSEGGNPISVVVTAEDGTTTKTYTITLTRARLAAFIQQAYAKASNTDQDDNFGSGVALSGNTLAVAARYEGSSAQGIDGDQSNNDSFKSGAVYVFTRDGSGTWRQQAYLKASNPAIGHRFGISVALDGDTLAVGAFFEGSSATGVNGDQSDTSIPGAGAVYVFTRDAADIWSQQAYLKASSSSGGGRQFGWSVSLSRDTLAVGAFKESSSATGVNGDQESTNPSAGSSGAVYVFTRDISDSWSQQAYIKASNTGSSDQFGWSVSVDGDYLVVGANQEESQATGVDGDQADDSFASAGAAYVFRRDSLGEWSQDAYLKASNTTANSGFAHSVSISGKIIAVGDPGDESVFIFERSASGQWLSQAMITPPSGSTFGSAVALSGTTLAVGALGANTSATNSGAIYIYSRDAAGDWVLEVKQQSSNPEGRDRLGEWIDLDGDTVAGGAYGEDSNATGVNGIQNNNTATQSGAVYVFQ